MSEILQSPDHPANIKLSEMCTSADNKKQSPYSVETPYGFRLDLDFLKYVDDIEKGNTIRKVYIHKKAKQPKYSTLPRNFSVTDTHFSSSDSYSCGRYGDKWKITSSQAPTNRRKGANMQELYKSSPCNNDPALSQPEVYDCRSGKTLSDARESLGENGLSPQSWLKPPFLRASSVPVDFKELSFEEQHQILSVSQQKLKLSKNYGFSTPGNAVIQENCTTTEIAPQLNVTPTEVHQLQRQVKIAQDRSKEMEEQVKTISELKQQVLVLQEENKQLCLQLKNQQNAVPTSSPLLERKDDDNRDKTDCVTAGSQSSSSVTSLGSETIEGQTLCPSKSTTSEFPKSDEKFQSEKVINLDNQINFASNVTVSGNEKFVCSTHKEIFQNSYAIEDNEHRLRDVGIQVTMEDLGLVLVPHPSTERLSIKEPRTMVSIQDNQFKGGTQEHKLEEVDVVPKDNTIILSSNKLEDSAAHFERKCTLDQTEVHGTSTQPGNQSNLGVTEPEVGLLDPNESKQMCKYDIKPDLRPVTQSVDCGDCSANVTDTNLIETRSLGVNTDHITISDAGAMAAVETSEKATDATVRVCSKAVETERDSSLHCICHMTSKFSKVNKEHTAVYDDNRECDSESLKNTKSCSAEGSNAVKDKKKECPVAVESQGSVYEKDDSQDAFHAFLQPESQIISTKPELAQSIKKVEDLLCKQQSFLEQNYPELAQNFKKLCSSIGSLSIQLINSFQPSTLSLPTLDQSEKNFAKKKCEPEVKTVHRAEPVPSSSEPLDLRTDLQPEMCISDAAVLQSTSLKSIMKKNSGNVKSSGASAKKNLQFIGVNGGYETTSSEESNSSEGGSDSDSDKDGVNTENQIQHTDVKAELSKDTERTGYEEIQPSARDATVTIMQHCTKSHEWKPSFFSACQNLKDHLSELGTTNDKGVMQNLNTVQWEWFRISSQKSAASDRVQAFLQELQEMSPELLHFIVNLADDNQNTALHYSVSHSNFHIVKLLLDTDMCNVDHQNKAGYTATMLASLASAETDEEVAVVMQLLRLGNVNVQASQAGQTALMLAVSHGRIDMVKALLNSGADVNIQDTDGSTALMCASEHGHVELVKLLLAQPGCNSALTDKDGSTAMNIALQAGQKDIAELLSIHMNSGISPTL
ncbi:KN motif and ankyrin repeat domain-containing protein 4-like [Pristis pectinata]|uniref:KN motif and ankyrin repeat domain-containing protein 4-like n=1 Tax=Pristis pectinata TaxID=685728 RepID=UPI00223DD69E|nr:KN motif and ankyrin repeat domain-containing protein 4-like [Pristis pectinata]XP_051868530.1 KN motif and ankyrin repeat domain-containing protein 4-like [Pristis pectinata]XP_051868531.1 KN motif and ankyrin repeat domain-containing protein 4-like [Pristis pectinata]XP_051868532.1 KN motif and ankyrin repeat domain-containing protein 4-like [Pristis pectinata]XP_051868533.1 KN motif and ankyrin repeat domain-containing protein 4-like [Pristis pectinata]XP_051868534.1 KN motif and ankyrin